MDIPRCFVLSRTLRDCPIAPQSRTIGVEAALVGLNDDFERVGSHAPTISLYTLAECLKHPARRDGGCVNRVQGELEHGDRGTMLRMKTASGSFRVLAPLFVLGLTLIVQARRAVKSDESLARDLVEGSMNPPDGHRMVLLGQLGVIKSSSNFVDARRKYFRLFCCCMNCSKKRNLSVLLTTETLRAPTTSSNAYWRRSARRRHSRPPRSPIATVATLAGSGTPPTDVIFSVRSS